MDYELIDSGDGEKLERFGKFRLIRPAPIALWKRKRPAEWAKVDGHFDRENRWKGKLPEEWNVEIGGVQFQIAPTEFGHLGVFPEHAEIWTWVREQKPKRLLNLFAYSGGVTLAAAQAGAEVCHVDAAKGMVDWARAMAAQNGLEKAPIRWIVDEAGKFMAREVRRGSRYDAIVLDPPTFGRGAKGEVFKIERDLLPMLELCKQLLERPKFVILSCHTPGFTPLVLKQIVESLFPHVEAGELMLQGKGTNVLPCGSFVRCTM